MLKLVMAAASCLFLGAFTGWLVTSYFTAQDCLQCAYTHLTQRKGEDNE